MTSEESETAVDGTTRTVEYEHPGDVHELINEVGHVLLDELWEEDSEKNVTVTIEVDDG